MAEKTKIGVMGGTFNPIHNGHLLMAQYAAEEFDLSEVIFIPTGIQWMKRDNPENLPGDLRLKMTEEAVSDNPGFSVSDMEIVRKGNTYTYETFERLTVENPDAEWYYIVGADSLINMEKWRSPERIFALCHILCAVRGEKDQKALIDTAARLKERFGARVSLLSMPRVDLSSTDIRRRVRENKSIRYMVPEKVRAFIREQGLYLS